MSNLENCEVHVQQELSAGSHGVGLLPPKMVMTFNFDKEDYHDMPDAHNKPQPLHFDEQALFCVGAEFVYIERGARTLLFKQFDSRASILKVPPIDPFDSGIRPTKMTKYKLVRVFDPELKEQL